MSANVQLARLAIASLSMAERETLLAEYASKPDAILRRADVAARFQVTARTVDQWTKRGALHKVRLPGASRAVGFRTSEVEALLAGKVAP